MRKLAFVYFIVLLVSKQAQGQVVDTIPQIIPSPVVDTPLRITNLNPFFTLQVDSTLAYQLAINKDGSKYYWFLRNSPVGIKINKDNGLLTFKADKSYFLSGKLKYDNEYSVKLGVQNLSDPTEMVDTSFTIVFYNTDVVRPQVRFTVPNTLVVDEGQTIAFDVLCESGNFPIEDILFSSSVSISNYKLVKHCDENFSWLIPYDFVSEGDEGQQKTVILTFIGSTRLRVRDTASIKLIVRDALNYPRAIQEHRLVDSTVGDYISGLQFAFYQLDRKVRKTKSARTGFDLTAASTALTGTILNTSSSTSSQNTGKVLPSVGVALTPIKEATSPNKSVEQNQASVIRAAIQRLRYMRRDNVLVGDKDPDVVKKTAKLRDEMKQVQVQLVDVPIDITGITAKEVGDYFDSPRVQKKYRMGSRKK
jgi:hypothetical protein